MEKNYKVLYQESSGEVVEKKSRFISVMRPVKTEDEAIVFINDIKKKYWDARHNCFAYVIGKDLQRFSDDGEPNGTAGKPMLDVLVSNNIHDVCVVVTRYFGGVLLGTGGLVRAYQKSVTEALSTAVVLEPEVGEIISIKTDYNIAGKIKHIMEKMDIFQNDIIYTENVEIFVVVSDDKKESFMEKITEAAGGKVQTASVKEVLYSVYESNLILF